MADLSYYDLLVIVPSRGRPDSAAEVWKAFEDTCVGKTALVFAVDESDPDVYDLEYTMHHGPDQPVQNCHVTRLPSRTMVEALNLACTALDPPSFAIAFMGDDHRPRTRGWDKAYIEALRELGTGIVYGNDLLQGEGLPTQMAMTFDIIEALGFMAPPQLRHMFVDNYWLDLGRGAKCLRYLPDVVVEHMHPIAQKAEWDANYDRVNALMSTDARTYAQYRAFHLADDIAKVVALRG